MTYGVADKYFCYLRYIVKVWLKTEMLIFFPELKRLKVFSNNNEKKKRVYIPVAEVRLQYKTKMKGTFYISYFCLGHFLVLFSFLLLQLNIFLQSLTSSSISF